MSRMWLVLGLSLAANHAARADFVPGRIYLSGVYYKGAGCQFGLHDRIYEFDPVTGDHRVFAVFPDGLCGGTSGLAFTPDGSYLRASEFSTSLIAQIDGDGNVSQVLGSEDGIVGPLGSNNIGYNAAGDFFAANINRTILRFPAASGPAEVYGDASDGVRNFGPLALAPSGDLYYGAANSNTFREIIRFTGAGESEVFDTLPQGNLHSLAVDSTGNVFALSAYGLFRYDAGDPTTRRLLAPSFGGSSLTLSADDNTLYVVRANGVFAMDPQSGSYTSLGIVTDDYFVGSGIAIAVPEPSPVFLLLVSSLVVALSARR